MDTVKQQTKHESERRPGGAFDMRDWVNPILKQVVSIVSPDSGDDEGFKVAEVGTSLR